MLGPPHQPALRRSTEPDTGAKALVALLSGLTQLRSLDVWCVPCGAPAAPRSAYVHDFAQYLHRMADVRARKLMNSLLEDGLLLFPNPFSASLQEKSVRPAGMEPHDRSAGQPYSPGEPERASLPRARERRPARPGGGNGRLLEGPTRGGGGPCCGACANAAKERLVPYEARSQVVRQL